MIICCFVMMIYAFLMIGVKSFDTHGNRLLFFNAYLAFPVLLYNMWYAFAIFNDWWISVPTVICRDTKNNPPRPNSPEFDACVQLIKDHTTTDLIINISFGLYLSYYFKLWADKKRDEEYDKQVETVRSDETSFFCLSLDNGVKLITAILVIKPLSISAAGLETGSTTPAMSVSFLMVQFAGVLPFLLVLGIKDNNTLAGRKFLFWSFVVIYLLGVVTMKYLVVTDDRVWGTTFPKLLCKDSTDPDCV